MRLIASFVLSSLALSATAADWFPVAAQVDGKTLEYRAAGPASKAWRICALLPHLRDKYWWGVSWGLSEEADRQKVKLGIYQAGGYDAVEEQRRQFRECLRLGADAIILASSSYEGLNQEIDAAADRRIPVVDLVNGVSSARVAARSLVSFTDMATTAARYISNHAGGKRLKLAWFPGPQGAGWVNDAEKGLQRAFPAGAAEIIHAGYAAPESTRQMTLVRKTLALHAPDYILGNAVATEVSAAYLLSNSQKSGAKPGVVSFYATEPVIALIREGRVLAAPSDASVLQARIAVDLAVRILDRKPFPARVSPVIEVLDAGNIDQYDLSRLFPPQNLRFVQKPLPQ
jgi:protein TorT